MSEIHRAKHPLIASILQEIQPRRLIPALTAGLIVCVIAVIVSSAFATLIFSGELSSHVSTGVNLMLFASIVIGGFVALTSSLPGLVTGLQDSALPILAIVSTTIVKTMPSTATSQETFFTVVAAIALSTILTGIVFFGLGYFRLGNLIRFIPYPVVGGYLAGIGLLLVLGALSVMVESFGGVADFPLLFKAGTLSHWLPGLIFAVLLLLALNRFDHPLTMPLMLLGAMAIFHIVPSFLGISSVSQVQLDGGSSPAVGGLENALFLFNLGQVHWLVLFRQTASGVAVAVVSIIALLLNATSLELTTNHDFDLNRELKMTGIANILAGLSGGMVGSHVLSDTTLVYQMGARSRIVGLTLAGGCAFALVNSNALLSLFPQPILGGLLLFLGLDFLVAWVYKSWSKLSVVDYSIVILILVVITLVGLLEGIGLGIFLSVILFVIDYSRIDVVRHTLSGATYQSNYQHARLYQQLLRRNGDRIYILELQGFIFFGTAYTLLKQVQGRIKDAKRPMPRFVVLDFRRVSGVDTSAVFSFARMKQLAAAQDVVLIFTHLSGKMKHQLEKEVFKPSEHGVWRIFPDLDRGVEWCETETIETFKPIADLDHAQSGKQCLPESPVPTDAFDNRFHVLSGAGQKQASMIVPPFEMGRLIPFMEQMVIQRGDTLIQRGELTERLYYIEAGEVTVQLEQRDGQTIRLSTMGEGAVVGELSFYLGIPASAAVIVDRPSSIYFLSMDKLNEMENTAPQIAAALHKFMTQCLGERLVNANDRVQALLQ